MDKEENKVTRSEFIGVRVSSLVKLKIEKYAKENDYSVGELMTLSVLLHIDKIEAGKLLVEKATDSKKK